MRHLDQETTSVVAPPASGSGLDPTREMMRLHLAATNEEAAGQEQADAAARPKAAAMEAAAAAAGGGHGAAAATPSPPSAGNDLMGNSLASYFSQLFEKAPPDPAEKKKDKKCKKCKKVAFKAKEKRKVSGE